MGSELTEEEMRRALFGSDASSTRAAGPRDQPELVERVATSTAADPARRSASSRASELIASLRVGNVSEVSTELFIYEASTLNTLQAELDAKKAAWKKIQVRGAGLYRGCLIDPGIAE